MGRIFRLSKNETNVRTEILAGVTTFLTMAYIIFVQPAVLSGKMFGAHTGKDFGAVTTATCLSAVLATAVMALYARYPIAQAPGMGENFSSFFPRFQRQRQPVSPTVGRSRSASCSCPACSFLILSLIGLRELIFNSVSPSMKNGIAAGIGLSSRSLDCARPV